VVRVRRVCLPGLWCGRPLRRTDKPLGRVPPACALKHDHCQFPAEGSLNLPLKLQPLSCVASVAVLQHDCSHFAL